MIDRLRIILDNAIIPEEKREGYYEFGKGRKNFDVKSLRKYIELDESKANELFEDDFDEEDDLDSEKELKKYRIELTINENKKTNRTQLIVEGSIRKWYFGIDNRSDFTKEKFCDCINRLSKEIGVEDRSLWNARVTQLETGVTLKMEDKDRGIVSCIFHYKGLDKNTYSDTGVEFKSSNYDVIFYDQLKRIYNRKGKKKGLRKKIEKNNFLFRYEIQSHKVSGTPMFKNKLNTLLKIKSNWNYIGDNLLKTLSKVKFVDTITPEMYVELKGSTIKPMKDYLIYRGIKTIGLENFRLIVARMNKKKKPEFLPIFLSLYHQFLEKDRTDYKELYTRKLKKRILSLSKAYRL